MFRNDVRKWYRGVSQEWGNEECSDRKRYHRMSRAQVNRCRDQERQDQDCRNKAWVENVLNWPEIRIDALRYRDQEPAHIIKNHGFDFAKYIWHCADWCSNANTDKC